MRQEGHSAVDLYAYHDLQTSDPYRRSAYPSHANADMDHAREGGRHRLLGIHLVHICVNRRARYVLSQVPP